MNTFLRYSFAFYLSIFLLSTFSPVFAAQEVPKKGDVIQLLIGGYAIEAQVVSITPPAAPKQQETKKTEQPPQRSEAPAGQTAESKTESIQEQYNDFAESNPVKTGIENFQNTVNDQVAKWYQLAANRTNLPATAALPKVQIDPRAVFAGLAIIGAVILFWLFKRSRKRRYNYDDDEDTTDEE